MQFSLKTLFLATAGVAVLFAVACTLPDVASLPLMSYVTLILPAATVALIVYGRGYVQAFAIGCAVSPVGPAIFAIPLFAVTSLIEIDGNGLGEEYSLIMKLSIFGFHFINISCGVLAVIARWCIERPKTHDNHRRTKVQDELIAHELAPSSAAPYAVIYNRLPSTEFPDAISTVEGGVRE